MDGEVMTQWVKIQIMRLLLLYGDYRSAYEQVATRLIATLTAIIIVKVVLCIVQEDRVSGGSFA